MKVLLVNGSPHREGCTYIFFGDYIAIMGLMIWTGHYLSKSLTHRIKSRCDRSNHI